MEKFSLAHSELTDNWYVVKAFNRDGAAGEKLNVTQQINDAIKQSNLDLLKRLKEEYGKYTWGHYDPFSAITRERERIEK